MSHAALASVYTDKNKYIKAIHELQISVRISPQDAALHYYLGMAFHNNGQDDLARYEFYDAVKYDRQDNWPSKESNKMLSGNLSR
jgi:Flp pilus assembly protein TadD